MSSLQKILLIADDDIGGPIREELGTVGFEVKTLTTWGKIDPILDELSENSYAVMIATNNGFPLKKIPVLVSAVKAGYPGMKILVLSGYADVKFAIEVTKCGANDFMSMPFDIINLVAVLERIIRE
jgi:DNA-binding NtrC family response regulator